MASMGPRSRERGNARGKQENVFVVEASMGPRSRERGNDCRKCGGSGAVPLQWGRAHVSAEIRWDYWMRSQNNYRFNGAALT